MTTDTACPLVSAFRFPSVLPHCSASSCHSCPISLGHSLVPFDGVNVTKPSGGALWGVDQPSRAVILGETPAEYGGVRVWGLEGTQSVARTAVWGHLHA